MTIALGSAVDRLWRMAGSSSSYSSLDAAAVPSVDPVLDVLEPIGDAASAGDYDRAARLGNVGRGQGSGGAMGRDRGWAGQSTRGEEADNLGGRSFGSRWTPEPIDVVYTWVNGSDPLWLAQLRRFRAMDLRRQRIEQDGDGDSQGGEGEGQEQEEAKDQQGDGDHGEDVSMEEAGELDSPCSRLY